MSAIDTYLIIPPDDYTLSEEYKSFIESLIPTLVNSVNTTVVNVSPETGYLYRGDLTSFLLDHPQNVPIEDHRVIMRMNGMYSSQEFDETCSTLLIPDQFLIGQLKQLFRSKQS